MDKELHAALDAIPAFTGKVFPVVQVQYGDDEDIELPSIVYTRSGSEPNVYLDEPIETYTHTYQVLVFARDYKDLDGYEDEVQAALEDLNPQDFRHFEDVYREEDGGIYIRIFLVAI